VICLVFQSYSSIWICLACLIRVEQNRSLFFLPVDRETFLCLPPVQVVGMARADPVSWEEGPRHNLPCEGRFLIARKCMEVM
jgi:hypothetical protein